MMKKFKKMTNLRELKIVVKTENKKNDGLALVRLEGMP